ncbi:hypothetical protein [uncultured Corynebacterium sp.]|uniref:hypothetical protein n=1 Tax=uncultured Corynebacterium sp. TaxID=159447 RepID=UPI0025969BAD|nr:hypothetical protein [uncultured Corynebacterium sp.]
MTLDENTIRELLDAAEPGPWNVAMLDLHRDTGVIDNEHAVANQKLATLAPELAAEVLRLHEALSAWIEDERAAENALHNASGLGNTATTHTTIINRINSILNGDIQ